MAEDLVGAASAQGGFTQLVLRLVNAFGPGQSQEYVIPKFIAQALAGRRLSVATPAARRRFLAVKDLCQQIVAGLEKREGRVVIGKDLPSITIGRLADNIEALVANDSGNEVIPGLKPTVAYYRTLYLNDNKVSW
jgi:nucleoside-diphosphate-sugar epimerase